MHELLKHVLTERDLTRAGDIFAISNSEIVDDLNEVIKQITEISSRPDYCRNDRDQALIEICVTRVTSCVKETGTLEKYCGALVSLLESCLNHNLMPVGHLRDDDPPHAKIASDIIACIVLVSFPIQCDKENRGNKTVMELFLPVAVQFLHKGNREISRHMARYLSLAAVHHAMLLKPHVQTIMDSIMSGNYPLCRILTNLYEVCPEPLEGHTMALASLLPHAEPLEKNSLLTLFEQMAARKPEALKTCIPQLISLLCPSTTSQSDPGCMCIDILQLLVCVAAARAALVAEHGAAVRRAARGPHASPRAVSLVAQLLTHVGYTGRERAQEALNFLVEVLPGAERQQQALLMRDATALCSAFPALFTDQLLNAVRAKNSKPKPAVSSEVNRTSSGVTIVKLSGAGAGLGAGAGSGAKQAGAGVGAGGGYTRRAKLGDSRSTGRLHPGPNSHRSMTRLNVAGGSVGGLHKSMTRLSSSQQINSQQSVANAANAPSRPAGGGGGGGGKPGGVTVTTVGGGGGGGAAGRAARGGAAAGGRGAHHHHIVIGAPPAATVIDSGEPGVGGPLQRRARPRVRAARPVPRARARRPRRPRRPLRRRRAPRHGDVTARQQHQRHHDRRGRGRRRRRRRRGGRPQQPPHQRVRAVPDARHGAALLREAPRQDQGVHGQRVAAAAAARQVHHRRAAVQEAGAAAVRLRLARAALPVRARALQHAHAQRARVDPPHVPGAAGAPPGRAVVARRLRRLAQALLGHTQVREQDLPHARHRRLPRDQGAGGAAERAARGRLLRRVRGAHHARRRRHAAAHAGDVGLLPVQPPGARAGLPGGRRAARHRGPAQGEEGPLAAVPPLAHQVLHALRRAPLLQGLQRRREHRHKPDPVGEGVPRRAQHPQGVRDLHRRPDAHPQAEGRQGRRAVGAVPQHRRRALAGARLARQGQQPARARPHAQEPLNGNHILL